jgi:hypothetical protein
MNFETDIERSLYQSAVAEELACIETSIRDHLEAITTLATRAILQAGYRGESYSYAPLYVELDALTRHRQALAKLVSRKRELQS